MQIINGNVQPLGSTPWACGIACAAACLVLPLVGTLLGHIIVDF